MDDSIICFIKVIVAGVIGWKLGVLERKIELIFRDFYGRHKTKELH